MFIFARMTYPETVKIAILKITARSVLYLTEKGGGLLGFTDLYGGYDGGKAEYVRVHYADRFH